MPGALASPGFVAQVDCHDIVIDIDTLLHKGTGRLLGCAHSFPTEIEQGMSRRMSRP